MKFGKLVMCAAAVGAMFIATNTQAAVIITGIVDGDLSGGNPKAIELYIVGTEDLSAYTLERSSNGGAFATSTALSGTYSNTFVYLVGSSNSGEAQFDAVFGTTGIYANRALVASVVNGNGNDGFRILDGSSTVVDQVWTTDNTDVYLDSYMYRVNGTGPDGGWVVGNWTIPGNAALDTLDAAGHAAAIPFGTFVIPEPASLALLGLGGLAMLCRRHA